MTGLAVEQNAGEVCFRVKVVPGSSRTVTAGLLGEMVKIKIAAAAENGKANRSLIKYLAQTLSLRQSDIRIISGFTGPVKQIGVKGLTGEQLIQRLGIQI